MRKVRQYAFFAGSALCATAAFSVLALILGALLFRGLPAVNWRFLTEHIALAGAAGGIFYNLVGTLILIATTLLVCIPIALSLGLLCGVYWRHTRWHDRSLIVLQLLNGVPSILFGIFGFIVFVKLFGWGKSWAAGGILLGLLILPTVTVTLIDRIEAVPQQYIEAASGLGLGTSQIIWSVIIPQSLTGLVTGALLGLARAAGETAPIMYTATIFAGVTFPAGIRDSPVLSLPYHIFILAQDSFDPGATQKLWGAALVLVCLVFVLSSLTLPIRMRIRSTRQAL
ncbi:MAG TPA: ABC transporter permease subunit [Steroidobacteraceae bacterium]